MDREVCPGRLPAVVARAANTIVVSQSTRAAVPDVSYRPVDCVRVKGKLELVTIYEPIGATATLDATILGQISAWQNVLDP